MMQQDQDPLLLPGLSVSRKQLLLLFSLGVPAVLCLGSRLEATVCPVNTCRIPQSHNPGPAAYTLMDYAATQVWRHERVAPAAIHLIEFRVASSGGALCI